MVQAQIASRVERIRDRANQTVHRSARVREARKLVEEGDGLTESFLLEHDSMMSRRLRSKPEEDVFDAEWAAYTTGISRLHGSEKLAVLLTCIEEFR